MSGQVMKISRGARQDRWRQHVNRLFPQFPFSSVVAMTAFVDSQAVLESRLKHAGMAEDIKDKLIAGEITSMSQLAFIRSYTPRSRDEAPLIAAFQALLT